MEHQLVVEHRAGCYEAHCTCGVWREKPVRLRVAQMREVLSRVLPEHRRHVRDFRTIEAGHMSPAQPKAPSRPRGW